MNNPNRGVKTYSRYQPEIEGDKLKYWPESKNGLPVLVDIPKKINLIKDKDGWWF